MNFYNKQYLPVMTWNKSNYPSKLYQNIQTGESFFAVAALLKAYEQSLFRQNKKTSSILQSLLVFFEFLDK